MVLIAFSLSVPAAPPKKGGNKKDDKIDAPSLIKRFDTDGDKKLDKEELKEALKRGFGTRPNIFSVKTGAMEKFDEDKDGKLDEKELAKLLAAEPKESPTATTTPAKGKK
ncbi:MAG TPA: EF-hand domain-containing protein [Verrucomicrobiaceae bacterium]